VDWTPEVMDRLEAAIHRGRRVALSRRGTEFVVLPRRLVPAQGREMLVAMHPTSGDELVFPLDELDAFSVLE
jgi:hypothetical protein